MLLKNLLGIDPKEMQQTVIALVGKINEIHAFMANIDRRLDRLERHFGVVVHSEIELSASEARENSLHPALVDDKESRHVAS